jgi:hypothetical protein
VIRLDRFPEAFERFEEVVDVDAINSFGELREEFAWWAGERWLDTLRQLHALAIQAQGVGASTASCIVEIRDRKGSWQN